MQTTFESTNGTDKKEIVKRSATQLDAIIGRHNLVGMRLHRRVRIYSLSVEF